MLALNGSFVVADGDERLALMEGLRSGKDLPKGDLADIDCVFMLEGECGMRGEGMVEVLEDMVVVGATQADVSVL